MNICSRFADFNGYIYSIWSGPNAAVLGMFLYLGWWWRSLDKLEQFGLVFYYVFHLEPEETLAFPLSTRRSRDGVQTCCGVLLTYCSQEPDHATWCFIHIISRLSQFELLLWVGDSVTCDSFGPLRTVSFGCLRMETTIGLLFVGLIHYNQTGTFTLSHTNSKPRSASLIHKVMHLYDDEFSMHKFWIL